MNKTLLSATGILVLGGILLFINALSSVVFRSAYVDLTEEGLYSLSEGSKNILESIEDPITLRYYFSRTDAAPYASLKLYAARVRDFLNEYQRHSGGKLSVEIYDPRPDTEEQEWAEKYGLSPIPDQLGRNLYFGLVGVNGRGQEGAIPIFNMQRQEFLEYDITKLIYSLMKAKKSVVGILTSLPIKGEPKNPFQQLEGQGEENDPWVFLSQLQDFYEVKHLVPTVTEIPNDVDLLMVIHPKDLKESTLYAIDQYVLSGKSLFVAVDPYCQLDQPPQDPTNPAQAMMAEKSSTLNKLLSKWGVEMVEKKVVGDTRSSTKVNSGPGAPPTDYVVWLSLRKPNMNTSNIGTSALENVLLPWAGALEVKQKDGILSEVLLSSSEEAMLVNEDNYRFGGGDPGTLLRNYIRGGSKQNLAVSLQGKFKTAFPGGAPSAEAKSTEENAQSEMQSPAPSSNAKHRTESEGNSHLVVIADVDFLGDRFSVASQRIFGRRLVSLINDNLVFLLNTVENLGGSDDLISIRSRGTYSRPFVKVQEIELRAQEKWQQEEMIWQAKLNDANQRLSQIQGEGGEAAKTALSKEAVEEVRKLREDRQSIQKRLSEVRRNLREDKESLGTRLFFLNTFALPILLVLGTLLWHQVRSKKRKGN